MKPTSQLEKCVAYTTGASIHDLDNQRRLIVRCTTYAMTRSPGELRFKSGIRPRPQGLPPSRSTSSRRHVQPRRSEMQPSAS